MNKDDDVSAFYRPEKQRWIIKYKTFSGEWRSKTTSAEIRTERAALDWGRGWLAEMRATGISPVKRAGNAGPTVSELRTRWLKLRREAHVNGQPEFKPSTLAAYEWHLDMIQRTFKETFKEEKPLGQFDTQAAREWVKTLKAGSAPNTCWNVFSTLRSLIEDAIAEKWAFLPGNPLALNAVLKEMPPRKVLTGKRPIFIELSNAQQLISSVEVPDHRRVRYIVDICTGLSEGELAGRIWSDVDLGAKPTIEVLNACAMLGTHGWATLSTTKNEHRVRKIPLHSAAAEALTWWKKEGWAQYVGRAPKLNDPVFPGSTGKFARPASAALLRKDLVAAGCSDKRHGHNITAQAMRRCFATYLDAANVPEEQRGRLMGHAKKTVTAKHYTDEQIETDRAAVELIALRWAPRSDLVSGLVSSVVSPPPNPPPSVRLTVRLLSGAPGKNRTCDLRFRKPLLYPLSYGGEPAGIAGESCTPRFFSQVPARRIIAAAPRVDEGAPSARERPA